MCEDVKHRISHTSSILTVDKGITAFVLASQYICYNSKLLQVALSQKILNNFFIAKMNTDKKHYP